MYTNGSFWLASWHWKDWWHRRFTKWEGRHFCHIVYKKIHKKNSFSGQILLKTKETDRSESFELFTLFLLVPNPRKVNNFINVMAAKKISLLCISSLKEWTMPFSLLFYRVFISNRERRHHENSSQQKTAQTPPLLHLRQVENKAWLQKSQDVFSISANLGDKVKKNKTENQQKRVGVLNCITQLQKPLSVKNWIMQGVQAGLGLSNYYYRFHYSSR